MTDLIVEESRRIVKLLEQVEQFGNLQKPKLEPVNIHDVLDRARKSAAVGYGAHMRFVEEYDPSLPRANADADQLLQVVLNLLKNASEAGEAGGIIKIRSFYDAALRVRQTDGTPARCHCRSRFQMMGRDCHPVSPSTCLSHLFRAGKTALGWGWRWVSKLVNDGGGWISVASVPGQTTFRISLPLAITDQGET